MAEARHVVSACKSHMAAQVDCTRESHPDAEMHLKHSHDPFSQERAFTTGAPWPRSERATGMYTLGAI